MDDPPNTTMFIRAGGGTLCKRKIEQDSSVAHTLTEAATAITSALSPRVAANLGPGVGSPAKLIESQSKLYKQLSELQTLRRSGVLTEEEYKAEKYVIMELLKQFNPK